MFVLKTQDGRYYNGRANLAWEYLLGPKSEAFKYSSFEEADRKAMFNNKWSKLSGYSWIVEIM